jgi:hypothetical protein
MSFTSPCARWRTVDRAIHVRLADGLHAADPEVAENLRATSPRYSDQPIRPAASPPLGRAVARIVGRGAIWIERHR